MHEAERSRCRALRRFAGSALALGCMMASLPARGSAQISADWPYHNVMHNPHFAPSDLSRLRWITGTWRVSTAGQPDTYEVCRFANDSTASITYYADAALERTTGDARLYLSGGRIFESAGPSRWSATLIDGHGVHFRPQENALDEFVWMEQSPDQWTETRRSGAVGVEHILVSTMTRLR